MNKEEAILELKKIISPHDTIYTNVTHVSKSGLSRWIKFYIVEKKENKNLNIDYYVSLILDDPIDKKGRGLKIEGCGMDMCVDSVYHMSFHLFGDGYKLKTGYL